MCPTAFATRVCPSADLGNIVIVRATNTLGFLHSNNFYGHQKSKISKRNKKTLELKLKRFCGARNGT